MGLAVAERYALEGFAVYALSRIAARLSSTASRLRSRGLDIAVIDCEPSNIDSVETAIRAIERRGGSCDVLVYNAFVDDMRIPSPFDPRAIPDERHAEHADVSALIRRRVAAMLAKQGGALVFAMYDVPESGTKTLREFVDTLAEFPKPVLAAVGTLPPEALIAAEGEIARRFVLIPLAGLAPDLRHPVTHLTVRQMLEAAPPQAVRRLAEPC